MSLDTSNQGDNIGITPIHMAIKTGHMDIAQLVDGLFRIFLVTPLNDMFLERS